MTLGYCHESFSSAQLSDRAVDGCVQRDPIKFPHRQEPVAGWPIDETVSIYIFTVGGTVGEPKECLFVYSVDTLYGYRIRSREGWLSARVGGRKGTEYMMVWKGRFQTFSSVEKETRHK